MKALDRRSVLAEKMVTLRIAYGATQQQMADLLCIHRTTYTKYETDKVCPDRSCLEQFARICHVSLEYLLSPTRDPLPEDCLRSDGVVIGVHPGELTMLMRFRELPAQKQAELLRTAEEMLRQQKEQHTDKPKD